MRTPRRHERRPPPTHAPHLCPRARTLRWPPNLLRLPMPRLPALPPAVRSKRLSAPRAAYRAMVESLVVSAAASTAASTAASAAASAAAWVAAWVAASSAPPLSSRLAAPADALFAAGSCLHALVLQWLLTAVAPSAFVAGSGPSPPVLRPAPRPASLAAPWPPLSPSSAQPLPSQPRGRWSPHRSGCAPRAGSRLHAASRTMSHVPHLASPSDSPPSFPPKGLNLARREPSPMARRMPAPTHRLPHSPRAGRLLAGASQAAGCARPPPWVERCAPGIVSRRWAGRWHPH